MTDRIWKIVGACAIAAIVLGLLFHFWQKSKTQALENRLGRSNAEAAVNASIEAQKTSENVAAAQVETEKTVRAGTEEIRAAPPGNSNAAAISATCRLKAYRDTDRCKPKVTK